MKKSQFTEAQIAFILRHAEEGAPVPEVCRKAGISDATYCNWRKKYAGLMPSEMKRLRQLEEEDARLKRIVADQSSLQGVGAPVPQQDTEASGQSEAARGSAPGHTDERSMGNALPDR